MKTKQPQIFEIVVTLMGTVSLMALACGLLGVEGRAQTDRSRQLVQGQTAPVSSWPAGRKRFALVIGVDEYQDPQVNALRGACNDARALAGALTENAGFPADHVTLLTSDQPLDHQPNRANIIRRLSNLRQAVPEDGLLLVSFSGHGMERGGKAYLLPMDAQVSADLAQVEDSAINVETMRQRIRDTGVKQVIVILDACRNNPEAGRGGGAADPLTEAYVRAFRFDVRNREVAAFVTLYATEVGHVAYEYRDKKQGYFTWALVEGLKGGAANERGEVTLSRLLAYVEEKVPERIRIDLGADKRQTPFPVIEGYADELVISVTPHVSLGTANLAPDPAVIELEFWRSIENSSNPKDMEAYLQRYPNGLFASIARNRLDKLLVSPNESSSRGTNGSPGQPPASSGTKSGSGLPHTAIESVNAGDSSYNKGDLDGALADYDRAINLDPKYPNGYVGRGNVRDDRGDSDGALADYNEAIELDPKDSAAYYNRGIVRRHKGDLEGALADYNKAIKLDPKYSAAYYNRGNIRDERGDLDGALADYNKAIELDPKYSKAYYNRGNVRRDKGDADAALADYNKAIELDPEYSVAYNNRGLVRYNKGDLEGAVADYNKAIQLDPKNYQAYGNLAWQLATSSRPQLRDGAKAVEYARKACELTGWKDGYRLDILAAAYAESGDFDNAIEWEGKALALPEYERNYGSIARQRLDSYEQRKPWRTN